ncbi:MAG: Beta-galactosidase C-terminal domain, partial [Lachnospiraceae bacterium]|nr:Beta-galactosidase C-terminal domain [Lachnospiraceae bacterium]
EAVKEWDGVEIAVRSDDAKKVYYLINHTDEEKEVMFPFDGEELTENARIEAGHPVVLAGAGVKVICVKL